MRNELPNKIVFSVDVEQLNESEKNLFIDIYLSRPENGKEKHNFIPSWIMPQSVFAFNLFVSFSTVSVSCANELHTLLKQRLKSTSPNQPFEHSLSRKPASKESFYT